MDAGAMTRFNGIKRKLMRLAPNVIVFVAVAALYLWGGLDFVENKLTDLRFQMIQRDAGGDLVVVEIDPASLREIDVWPWPRGLYAVALEKLLAAGARRVAFNIDFSLPSVMEEDQMLQRALAQSNGKAILPLFKQFSEDAESGRRLELSLPIPEFRALAQLAFINVQPEADGLIRRMTVRESWNRQELPSLPFSLTDTADFGFDSFFIDYGIRINSIPRVSFVDVLRGTFDAATVTGKRVIIGATAIELVRRQTFKRGMHDKGDDEIHAKSGNNRENHEVDIDGVDIRQGHHRRRRREHKKAEDDRDPWRNGIGKRRGERQDEPAEDGRWQDDQSGVDRR